MFGLRIGGMGRVGSALTLTQQAINILRRPGLESHVYMPGVGWVNGVSAGNFSDTGGTTAAVVDSTAGIGLMVDASGDTPAINASQGTTANKPILRRGHVNRIRNSTMVGAVAGTPGTQPNNWLYGSGAGITRSIVGTGTADGLAYVDVRFSGTASATSDALIDFDGSTQVAALNGQTWTLAATLSLVGGAWPARTTFIRITERNSGGSFLASTDVDVRSLVPSTTPVRVSVTRTLNQATTAFVSTSLRCPVVSGDVLDFTVRIAAPQLETGSVANTFVPTTTAAASASTGPFWMEFDGTDFLSLAAVPFQASESSCVILAANHSDPSTTSRAAFALSGAASQRAAAIYCNNQVWRYRFVDDAATAYEIASGSVTLPGVTAVVTGRKAGNTRTLRVNGVQVGTNSTAVGATTLTAANLGAISPTPSGQFLGSIGLVLAIRDVGGVLTDADVSILERYVAQASGVTL